MLGGRHHAGQVTATASDVGTRATTLIQMLAASAEGLLAEARKRRGSGHTTSRSELVLPEMRRLRLAEMIRSEGEIRLHTAARVLGVSEMTARRDLELLQIQGVARRVHGGAVAVLPSEFSGRGERASAAKVAIAAKLLELVPARGAIVLDASSTVAALAAKLPDRDDLAVFTTTANPLQQLDGSQVATTDGRDESATPITCTPKAPRGSAEYHT